MFCSPTKDRSINNWRIWWRRTGFQPVCLLKTGWKPVLLISRTILKLRGDFHEGEVGPLVADAIRQTPRELGAVPSQASSFDHSTPGSASAVCTKGEAAEHFERSIIPVHPQVFRPIALCCSRAVSEYRVKAASSRRHETPVKTIANERRWRVCDRFASAR